MTGLGRLNRVLIFADVLPITDNAVEGQRVEGVLDVAPRFLGIPLVGKFLNVGEECLHAEGSLKGAVRFANRPLEGEVAREALLPVLAVVIRR
jgi:hypothetical protein